MARPLTPLVSRSLLLMQLEADSFGLFLWPSARVLARYLWSRRSELLAGKTVLELGAGTGLPGLVAALPGSQATTVILTDR